MKAKEILKILILKACGQRSAQNLRHRYLARQVVSKRASREPEMAVLKHILSAGDVVADVGANVGVYTEEFSSLVGTTGRVYSFEPIAETYEILETVIRRAHLSNVQPYCAALGSQAGEQEMVIPDLGGFTGYYWAHFANPGESGQRQRVPVLALDDLYRQNKMLPLDFIKCDVEGRELDVIKGGQAVIHDQCPSCLVEVSRETGAKVFSLFTEFGYQSFAYDGGLVRTETYRDKQYTNYFFFHPASKMWKRVMQLTH